MALLGAPPALAPAATIVSDDISEYLAEIRAAVNTALMTDLTQTAAQPVRLANNVYLVGRNQANSADISMWKVGTDDVITAGVAVKPVTDSALDFGTTALRWLTIFADKLVLTTETPASAAATGTAGQIAWDTGFLYVCTATNTWERVAIATW